MVIAIHVVIAISSLLYVSLLALMPKKLKFSIGYLLVGLTIGTGTYIVLKLHQPMLPSCEAGLFYLLVASTLMVVARRRLVTEKTD